MRRIIVSGVLALGMVVAYMLGTMRPALPILAQTTNELCFAETGKCIRGAFLTYWQSQGGLRQHGFPISDELREQNAPPPAGDGKVHTVQYFQRSRFEYHEEFAGTEHEVLLGLLGAEQYQARYGAQPGTEQPLSYQGRGSEVSPLFDLRGGRYLVQWSARDEVADQISCYFGSHLEAELGGVFELIAIEVVPDAVTRSGETHLAAIKPGRYAIRVNSGCAWSVTIRPVP